MIIGTIIKQPSERLDYDVDCNPAFRNDGSDFVSAATVEVTPTGELTAAVIISGPDKVKIWVENGVDGVDYTIELFITTDIGRVKEDEILVKVKEFE